MEVQFKLKHFPDLIMELLSIEESQLLGRIIVKRPASLNDNGSSPYLSELWYKTPEGGRAVKPVFRCPRLKVQYACRKYMGKYSFCVSLMNRDIDDEIGRFFAFIQNFDSTIMREYSKNNKTWNMTDIKRVYRSALCRKSKDHEYYFKVRLLGDSTLHNCQREVVQPDDIVYGQYADMIIGPAYVYYGPEGVSTVWCAHQVVISPYERVFLRECLLDIITGSPSPPIPPIPPIPPPIPTPITTSTHQSYLPETRASHGQRACQGPNTGALRPTAAQLMDAMSRLRKTAAESNS
jgi:hypothetical protein